MARLPVRQWVLSVPERVRYFLQYDAAVQTLTLHLFLSALERLREIGREHLVYESVKPGPGGFDQRIAW